MFPVRCFTCGSVIARHWDEYNKKIKSGKSNAEALDELEIDRYCCRRMFLTHKSIISELARFHGAVG